MQRKIFSMCVVIVFTLGFALAAMANVPAPPVNQFLGIPDSVFTGLEETDCRFCHEDPNIVDDANIPNRHHNKVNTPVPSGICAVSGTTCERNTDCPLFDVTSTPQQTDDQCSVHTDRPFPAGDTAGNYNCYSCHNLIWDNDTMSSQFEVFRDCTFCHKQDPLAPTVHHATTKAKNRECIACHGPIDDPRDCLEGLNPDDRIIDANGNQVCDDGAGGNRLPTYDPSLVTPCTSPIACLNVPYKDLRADGAGQCEFCHDADPEPTTVTDPFTGAFGDTDVFRNSTNHHSTGVLISADYLDKADPNCALCHDVRDTNVYAEIRGCEACHGPTSVHNIQVDSPMTPTGMIEPNNEMPYYGHIGSNDDCQGCHGFLGSAAAPGTGPIFANIDLLSAYDVVAGADTTITVTGSAIQNEIMGNIVTASFVLTAADGSETTLAANVTSASSADITIPGTVATGNYTLRAVKGANRSNATVIAVIPNVTIASVECEKKKGILTVTGSGFGDKPEGTDADLNLQVNGQTMELIAWGDTQIKASVDRCRNASIAVNALFGSASNGKPCKGKKCR